MGPPQGHRFIPTPDPDTLAITGMYDRRITLFNAATRTTRQLPLERPHHRLAWLTADGTAALEPYADVASRTHPHATLRRVPLDPTANTTFEPASAVTLDVDHESITLWNHPQGPAPHAVWRHAAHRWLGVSPNHRHVFLLVSTTPPFTPGSASAIVFFDTQTQRWLTRVPLPGTYTHDDTLAVSPDGAKAAAIDQTGRGVWLFDAGRYSQH
jgi:hypothetical protein